MLARIAAPALIELCASVSSRALIVEALSGRGGPAGRAAPRTSRRADRREVLTRSPRSRWSNCCASVSSRALIVEAGVGPVVLLVELLLRTSRRARTAARFSSGPRPRGRSALREPMERSVTSASCSSGAAAVTVVRVEYGAAPALALVEIEYRLCRGGTGRPRSACGGRFDASLDGQSIMTVSTLADRHSGTARCLARGFAHLRPYALHMPRNARFHARIRLFDREVRGPRALVAPALV
jgi:hypothetical protein